MDNVANLAKLISHFLSVHFIRESKIGLELELSASKISFFAPKNRNEKIAGESLSGALHHFDPSHQPAMPTVTRLFEDSEVRCLCA